MTSTQESTRPIPLIGQAVGQAQASLAKILLGILAETQGGTIRLSAQGRGLREGVLAASVKITGPMLATIDRDELETTVRTLDEITRRAGIPRARLVISSSVRPLRGTLDDHAETASPHHPRQRQPASVSSEQQRWSIGVVRAATMEHRGRCVG